MIWFDCVVVALTIVSKLRLALPLFGICYCGASLVEPTTSLPGPNVSSRHQFRTSLTCNMNRPATIYVNEIRMPFNQKRPNGSQRTIMREKTGQGGGGWGGARALPRFPLPPSPPPLPLPPKRCRGRTPGPAHGASPLPRPRPPLRTLPPPSPSLGPETGVNQEP